MIFTGCNSHFHKPFPPHLYLVQYLILCPVARIVKTLLKFSIFKTSVTKHTSLKVLLAASKKAITRKWLKKDSPTVTQWIDMVKKIHHMEQMTFALRTQQERGQEYWEKWVSYLKIV